MTGFALGIGVGTRRPVGPGLPPLFDFTGGALPPGAMFGRATAGTRFGPDGVLASVGVDGPRFDHDPATGSARGLLIEPAGGNLLPRFGRIDLIGETNACAVAAGAGPAPDGAGTFARLSPTAGQGVFPYIADTSVTKAPGTTYTLSLFVRRETLRWVLLSGGLYGDGHFAWFDLIAGAVGTVGANASGAAIVAHGAGVHRIAVTFAGSSSPYCLIAPVKADAAFGADYAAGDTLAAWGLMLETGPRATSPVPTDGAAASRAADGLTLNWGARGVPDGTATIRYGFDDGSTQDVATTIGGGLAAVPASLARPWLRTAARV